MFKRVSLLVLTNVAILVALSGVWKLLSATGVLAGYGLGGEELLPLLFFATIFGFGGAFVSLLLSKFLAKRSTGARVITKPGSEVEAWLLQTVHRQAKRLGLKAPEVAIFDSAAPNAFATGARRNNALVAVSTGLLSRMERHEVEAVLAHEMSHVANGDMVTLTLIQGVVNTFVILIARVIGSTVDRAIFRSRDGYGPAYYVATIASEIVLGIGATMIVMAFSRWREYRADAGAAEIAGASSMVDALRALARGKNARLPEEVAAFGIRGGSKMGIMKLFASHPPIQDRIARLREKAAAQGERRSLTAPHYG